MFWLKPIIIVLDGLKQWRLDSHQCFIFSISKQITEIKLVEFFVSEQCEQSRNIYWSYHLYWWEIKRQEQWGTPQEISSCQTKNQLDKLTVPDLWNHKKNSFLNNIEADERFYVRKIKPGDYRINENEVILPMESSNLHMYLGYKHLNEWKCLQRNE